MKTNTNGSKMTTRDILRNTTLATSALLLAACAAGITKNPDVDRVRADLTALQSNPNLANQSPIAMQDAEQAVREAELPDADGTLTAHRVYLADRKVQTAKSLATAQYTVAQRKALSDQNDQVRLDARTREADIAKRDAGMAKRDADAAKQDAEAATRDANAARTQAGFAISDANAARTEADLAKSKNDALLAELSDLKAKKTDRGVQLTLGDVLFSSGRAELKAGSAVNLDKLVVALSGAPDRNITIEGYTDSLGSDDMNMALSQRRANAVSAYLTGRGIAASRITAIGKGEAYPVAGNEIAAGRQLNRRVEVTIQNPPQ